MFYMNLLSSNSSFTRTKCGASRCRANTVKMPFSKLTIMFFLCLYLFRNSAAPKYPPATRWVVLLRLCLCRQGGTVKLWFLFFFFFKWNWYTGYFLSVDLLQQQYNVCVQSADCERHAAVSYANSVGTNNAAILLQLFSWLYYASDNPNCKN